MSKDKKKVPNLRFKGFTDDWKQRKLGDFGKVAMNKRIFKNQTSDEGDVPFYKIGTFGGVADSYITKELFEEYKLKYPYPRKGDLLISASGSIGRVIEYSGKDEYFQDSNIVWLDHDNRLDNSFLKQFYNIIKWQGLEGSTIKRLYNKNILATKIDVPSISEQLRIGDFFQQFDTLITLHQRKLVLLKQLKKGLLQKMFAEKNSKQPVLRFKGFNDDWEQRKLIQVANYRNGRAHEKDINMNGNYIVVNSKFVSSNGRVKKFSSKLMEPLNKGEIAFVLSDVPNGKALARTFLVKEGHKYSLNQRIAGITPHQNISSYFLYILMNRNPYFLKFDDGVGQTNLSKKDVEQFSDHYPSGEEQQMIGKVFGELDRLITLQQQKLAKYQSIKKSLLQQMFI